MTTLEMLNALAVGIGEYFAQPVAFLSVYGLTGQEAIDENNIDYVWLAYADMLEVTVSLKDYDEGQVSEKIDRSALLEIIQNIRSRHKTVTINQLHSGEEV